MKKELAEKEAKYAEQGTGATVDVENVLQDDDSSVQAQIDQVETAAELSYSEQLAHDAVMQALSNSSIPVVMATNEMVEETLTDKEARLQAVKNGMERLKKAERFIDNAIKGNATGSFTIMLPEKTLRKIRAVAGFDFNSHNISATNIIHSKNNHGENGRKITINSIPLKDEDFRLLPYIMTAPDVVQAGSTDASGRTSIRFIKNLSNGIAIVVEKEQKDSPDDLETITMWADLSPEVADARRKTSPAIDVRNVILSTDAAKIVKDAENAIATDITNFSIDTDGISDETIQQYQERLSEIDNHIRSWKNQGRSIPEAFWRERGKVIKQFLDEIGTMPAVMVTRSNFEQIMSSNGCDADLIDDVRARLEYEEISGLYLQGNVYVFANDVKDMDEVLITYLHERQHYITHQDFINNLNQVLGRAESLKELQNAVVAMSGNQEYKDLDKENLVDEFISFAMALSYTNVNFADELRNIGVNEQLISYIDEYSKSQWNQAGWANSRKKRTEAAYDGQGKTGSSGENGRDSRTESQEMGQQGLRTVSGSPQTTGERKFFKSRVGTVRGWTKGGVIYLTKDGLNPDTPIHEYTHIWADVVQKFNPALWNNVKSLMKRLPQWQQVVSDPNYQDIAGNEDAVASEVLARYSGKRGARRLEQDAKAMGESTGRRGSAARLLERVKEAIAQFWDWVNVNLFNLSGFSSAEEVADRVLYDLISGTDLNRPADITTQILDNSGTAELLGAEAHAAMMDEVFGGMEVIQQARAARGDRAANTREYISHICENVATRGDQAMKIAAAVRAAFTDKGMRLEMSDAALLHQMWKECNTYPDTTVKEL